MAVTRGVNQQERREYWVFCRHYYCLLLYSLSGQLNTQIYGGLTKEVDHHFVMSGRGSRVYKIQYEGHHGDSECFVTQTGSRFIHKKKPIEYTVFMLFTSILLYLFVHGDYIVVRR